MSTSSVRPRAERLVPVGDTKLYVREWGGADAPALLFWHALGDHTGLQVAEVARTLVDASGLRVLAFDAPGWGESPGLVDPERYLPSRLGALVADAVDVLELERPMFAGSSWGATVAVAAAAERPHAFRGIVLLDGAYQRLELGGDLEELRAHWRTQPGFRYASWSEWEDDTRGVLERWSPELAEVLRAGFREEDGAVVSIMGPDRYATVIWTLGREPARTFLPALAGSRMPVLLIAATKHGEKADTRAAEVDEFVQAVPQAAVERVPDAPHLLAEERPDDVARRIGAWARPLYS
jgi:pimeloyl-ACP methyl ester carboxylesterase